MSVVNNFYTKIEAIIGELPNDKKNQVQKVLLSLYNRANTEGYTEALEEARKFEAKSSYDQEYEKDG